MFDIFIKRSEVVLDCFTTLKPAFDTFKISPSSRFVPEWWKNLPNNPTIINKFVGEIPSTNMKGCVGFIDFYKNGLIMPMWQDLIVTTSENDYAFQFACGSLESSIQSHPSSHTNNSFSYFHNLKLISPWFFSCKKDIKFFWGSPFWNYALNENFIKNVWVIPGVVEYKNQSTTNINLFLTKTNNKHFFEAGMPLVYLYPNTDKKITIKHHLIGKDELFKYTSPPLSFKKSYFKKIKYNNMNNSCPFK